MAAEQIPLKLLFQGDWKAGQDYVRIAKTEAARTADLAGKLEASQYRRFVELWDGGPTITTQVHGKFHYAIIYVPPEEGEVPELYKLEKEEKHEDEVLLKAGIYSGFAYTHQISNDYIDGPPPLGEEQWIKRMYDFNPTVACRAAYPDDFTAASYQPVTRLALTCDYKVENADAYNHDEGHIDDWRYDFGTSEIAQTNVVKPCRYSGPLARACSLALGNGNFNLFNADEREALLDDQATSSYVSTVRSIGFRVQYGHNWWDTETALKDNQGNWWIVQINLGQSQGGVFARRMPIITAVDEPANPVEAAAVAEFGGIPTGESVPYSVYTTRSYIDNNPQDWLLLIDNDDPIWQRLYWDENCFEHTQSWVFNDTGKEGRVCTYQYLSGSNFVQVAYWKINISITDDGNGNVNGSASISLIEEDICNAGYGIDLRDGDKYALTGMQIPQNMYDAGNDKWWQFTLNASSTQIANYADQLPATTNQCTWVGWIDSQWHEIRFKNIIPHRWDFADTAYVKLPIGEWGYTGPRDTTTGDWSTLVDIQVQWTSPYKNWADVYEYAGDSWRSSITGHQQVAGGFYSYQESGATTGIREWKEISEISRYTVKIPQDYLYRTAVMAPYNRNAYFIWDYSYNGGGGDQWWNISSAHIHNKAGIQFQYSYLPSPDYQCSTTGYPYPYVGNVPEKITALIVPPAPPGYLGGVSSSNFAVGTYYYASSLGAKRDSLVAGDPCSGDFWCACELELYNRFRVLASFMWGYNTGYTDLEPESVVELTTSIGSAHGTWEVGTPYGPEEVNDRIADSMYDMYGFNLNIDRAFDYLAYESCDIYLVADGAPGGTFRFLGTISDEEAFSNTYHSPSSTNNSAARWWCQVPVLGAKAMIYNDPTPDGDTYPSPAVWPYIFSPMKAEGTHPALPTSIPGNLQYASLIENNFYRWLTFVGVNGP